MKIPVGPRFSLRINAILVMILLLLSSPISCQDEMDDEISLNNSGIQVTRIYEKNKLDAPTPLFKEKAMFIDQNTQLGYSTLSECIRASNITENSLITGTNSANSTQCPLVLFNSTNLLQDCEIRADSQTLALFCDQKFFFVDLNEFANASLSQSTWDIQGEQIDQQEMSASDQAILNFLQSEHLMCYHTTSYLQCRQTQSGLLFEPLFMRDDDPHKQPGRNIKTILTIAQLATSPSKSIIIIAIGDSPLTQSKEDINLNQRTSIGSTLTLIIMHTDKELVDFVSQQTTIDFPIEQLGGDSQSHLNLNNLQMSLNERRGSLNLFAFFDHSFCIFEEQAQFKPDSTPILREKYFLDPPTSTILYSDISYNMIALITYHSRGTNNQSNCTLLVFRMTEFSFEIQKVLEHSIECANGSSTEILLRISQNRNSNKFDLSTAYLIHIIDQDRGVESVIAVSEFSGSQKYLRPVYSLLRDRVKLQWNALFNEADIPSEYKIDPINVPNFLKHGSIDETKSEEISNEKRARVQDMRVVSVRNLNFALYATDVGLFFKPLCFQNSAIITGVNSENQQLTFKECQQCAFQTYSKVLNARTCEAIESPENQSQVYETHPLAIVQFKENLNPNCPVNDLMGNLPKGPTCSSCTAFLREYYYYDTAFASQSNSNSNSEEELETTPPESASWLSEDNSVVCNYECTQELQKVPALPSIDRIGRESECVSDKNLEEYRDFCSKISNCFSCSFHPFCMFNAETKKCQKLNFDLTTNFFGEWQEAVNAKQENNSSEKNSTERIMPFSLQKFEVCTLVTPQSFCSFSNVSTRSIGGILEFVGGTAYQKEPKNSNDGIINLRDDPKHINDDDQQELSDPLTKPRFRKDTIVSKFQSVQQHQMCSWLILNESSNDDKQFLIRIATEEGFIKHSKEIMIELSVCQESQYAGQPCKLSKIRTSLSEATIQRIRVLGGNFRLILQFQEGAEIDPSKITMSYSMISNQNWHRIIITITIGVILFFILIIIAVLFKNQILACIRVHCNTLMFLDFEEDTQLNDLSIKRIMRQLEKNKLLQLNQKFGKTGISPFFHTDCSICLIQFSQEEDLCVLMCRHAFHQACIEEWARVQFIPVTCPICKISLTKEALAQLQRNSHNQTSANPVIPRESELNQHDLLQHSIELEAHSVLEVEHENFMLLPDLVNPVNQQPQEDVVSQAEIQTQPQQS